jgi:REP element-mobilizing transposase RayT
MTTTPDWIQPVSEFKASRRHLPHIEVPDGYFFTTACTKVRGELTEQERDEVLSAIRYMDGKKYDLDAAVVMPDHFHLLLHPKRKDAGWYYSLSEIFHSIKSYSARQILQLRQTLFVQEPKVWTRKTLADPSRQVARRKTQPENKIWQDENHDHLIRNEKDYSEKLQYILFNAVVKGLVSAPFEYPWLYWIGMPDQPNIA